MLFPDSKDMVAEATTPAGKMLIIDDPAANL
jgi:hypothetical protein